MRRCPIFLDRPPSNCSVKDFIPNGRTFDLPSLAIAFSAVEEGRPADGSCSCADVRDSAVPLIARHNVGEIPT